MFTPKPGGYEGMTVIAEGVRVDGDFTGDGTMTIDGAVHGTITTSQAIVVGKTAHIEATLKVGSIVVSGRVRGNIVAKDRVELTAGSRVDGDVTAKTLVVAEGATLNGKCTMGGEANRTAAPKEKEADPANRRLAVGT